MESKPVCKGTASVPLGTTEVGSLTAKPRVSCSLPPQGASSRCGCCFTARKPSFQGREIFRFIFLANCSGTPQWKIRNAIHHKCSLNLSLIHESTLMRKTFKLHLVFPFKNYSFPGLCLFFWFILLVGLVEIGRQVNSERCHYDRPMHLGDLARVQSLVLNSAGAGPGTVGTPHLDVEAELLWQA